MSLGVCIVPKGNDLLPGRRPKIAFRNIPNQPNNAALLQKESKMLLPFFEKNLPNLNYYSLASLLNK